MKSAAPLIAAVFLITGCGADWMTRGSIRYGHKVGLALDRYGEDARKRLIPFFREKNVPFPPGKIALLVFKREKSLELWAIEGVRRERIRSYPVTAVSGDAGPKLREGDKKTPEGIYRVTALNPESKYHLSLLLDYPNEFDRAMASREGRDNPGSDIYIHGKDISVGCVAVGDMAAEELFLLAALTGIDRITVVIAPWDMRKNGPHFGDSGIPGPAWTRTLYDSLKKTLDEYK